MNNLNGTRSTFTDTNSRTEPITRLRSYHLAGTVRLRAKKASAARNDTITRKNDSSERTVDIAARATFCKSTRRARRVSDSARWRYGFLTLKNPVTGDLPRDERSREYTTFISRTCCTRERIL